MDTSTLLHLVSTLSAGVFTGAAIYVNAVEHPARLLCGPDAALKQWRPSYKRAAVFQGSLAALSFLTSMVNRWFFANSQKDLLLVGSCLIGFVWPFTLFGIMPVNKVLLDEKKDLAPAETSKLLDKWGSLHAVRSIASAIAFGIFAYIFAS